MGKIISREKGSFIGFICFIVGLIITLISIIATYRTGLMIITGILYVIGFLIYIYYEDNSDTRRILFGLVIISVIITLTNIIYL